MPKRSKMRSGPNWRWSPRRPRRKSHARIQIPPIRKWIQNVRAEPTRRGGGKRQSTRAALTLPEPRRIRDRDHVRYVAKQPCLICGRQPCDAHHLRFAQSRALGRKVSDEFTVPLCRGHHREVHRVGDEAAWWIKAGIEPTAIARELWLNSHPLRDRTRQSANSRNSTGATPPSCSRSRKRGLIMSKSTARPTPASIFARAAIRVGLRSNDPGLVKAGRDLLRRSTEASVMADTKSGAASLSAPSSPNCDRQLADAAADTLQLDTAPRSPEG